MAFSSIATPEAREAAQKETVARAMSGLSRACPDYCENSGERHDNTLRHRRGPHPTRYPNSAWPPILGHITPPRPRRSRPWRRPSWLHCCDRRRKRRPFREFRLQMRLPLHRNFLDRVHCASELSLENPSEDIQFACNNRTCRSGDERRGRRRRFGPSPKGATLTRRSSVIYRLQARAVPILSLRAARVFCVLCTAVGLTASPRGV
jgi:hypothetical protein